MQSVTSNQTKTSRTTSIYLTVAILAAQSVLVCGVPQPKYCKPTGVSNPNDLTFESLFGLSTFGFGKDYNYQICICAEVGNGCNGVKTMLSQYKGRDYSNCLALGAVEPGTWTKNNDGNFVLKTNRPGSPEGCVMGETRSTELEFVCDPKVRLHSQVTINQVTPPAEGEATCGVYKAKVATCLACQDSRNGKCSDKPSPQPGPTTTLPPKKDQPNSSAIWYILGAIVIVALGYFVYTRQKANFDDSYQKF